MKSSTLLARCLLTLTTLTTVALSGCGGGGSMHYDHLTIPEGIPVINGGFANWTDVQPTPDSTIGIVNGTGQTIVTVTFTDAGGDETFLTNIAPGDLWSSGMGLLPGFYLVRVIGLDGRSYARYFMYDPDIGSEAAVISNMNWEFDL